jgi:hypothetical protein
MPFLLGERTRKLDNAIIADCGWGMVLEVAPHLRNPQSKTPCTPIADNLQAVGIETTPH